MAERQEHAAASTTAATAAATTAEESPLLAHLQAVPAHRPVQVWRRMQQPRRRRGLAAVRARAPAARVPAGPLPGPAAQCQGQLRLPHRRRDRRCARPRTEHEPALVSGQRAHERQLANGSADRSGAPSRDEACSRSWVQDACWELTGAVGRSFLCMLLAALRESLLRSL